MATVDSRILEPIALLRPGALAAKRTFDLVVGALVLLVMLPLLLALMVAVWIESSGNPIFVQDRLGQYGQRFRLYKLRTMVPDAEQRRGEVEYLNESKPPLFKARNDPRVTRIGRFLRASSLDELPQLLNVVKGEMSIVGPRPRLPEEFEDVMQRPDIVRRFSAKPGLAGVWQTRGRAHNNFDEALALDLYYVDHWSFWFDIKLVVETFWVVVTGQGAY
jgi:lipopolysaccharide/colanic/teichoic acid biosynthesis glycosyltransferase